MKNFDINNFMLNENQLIDKIKSYNDFVDINKLKTAYKFAHNAHIKQKDIQATATLVVQ